jgi:hypothetical protein
MITLTCTVIIAVYSCVVGDYCRHQACAYSTQAAWIRTVWKNARMLLLLIAVLLDLFLLTLFLVVGLKTS